MFETPTGRDDVNPPPAKSQKMALNAVAIEHFRTMVHKEIMAIREEVTKLTNNVEKVETLVDINPQEE